MVSASDSCMTNLTRADIESIVEAAVRRAFRDIGVNGDEAFEHRRDLEFLREWRKICELSRSRMVVVLVTMAVTAAIGAVALGIRNYFTG